MPRHAADVRAQSLDVAALSLAWRDWVCLVTGFAWHDGRSAWWSDRD